jgi:Zn-dependent protease
MNFYDMLLAVPALMISLAFHEYAHAKAADLQGDTTPRLAGRLTLNPLAHIDPVGLIVFWIFRFGWAKPVPINPYRFRDKRFGTVIVSLAGPLTNFLLAFAATVLFRSGLFAFNQAAETIVIMLIIYNASFGLFNLIPIPPLDGSHVLKGLVGRKFPAFFRELESFGMIILLVLLWTGIAGRVLVPAVNALIGVFDWVARGIF